ncbi:MarR family winged helix-turn-helix transcriptional regulator [Raineyella antarctica]|nr:MarR family transcriptional regulator [Raineyella antarctica]
MTPPTTTESAPRWLTDEQQEIWLTYLRGVHQLDDYLDRHLRPFGLSLAEYEIFVALSASDLWRMRMSDLAEAVHQSRSRLTHTVARLEKAGYVERIACPSDRRGVWAQLTSTGFELLEKAAPSHVASVRHALVDAVDPDDFRALGRVFGAVLAVEDEDLEARRAG